MRTTWWLAAAGAILLGCGGDDGAGARASDANVTEAGIEGDVCGLDLDGEATCDRLAVALSSAHSLSCTSHTDCRVSSDPLCVDDGGGYPYVWSSVADRTRVNCLADAYWAAGCQGVYCDWWGPVPKAACFGGQCTQLKTGCEVDADCGEGQVCLTDESVDARWPTRTYCELAP